MATRLTSQTVAQDDANLMMALIKGLILRSPQRGCLEGRTVQIPKGLAT